MWSPNFHWTTLEGSCRPQGWRYYTSSEIHCLHQANCSSPDFTLSQDSESLMARTLFFFVTVQLGIELSTVSDHLLTTREPETCLCIGNAKGGKLVLSHSSRLGLLLWMELKTDFWMLLQQCGGPSDPFHCNTNLNNKTHSKGFPVYVYFCIPIDNSDSFKFILGQICVFFCALLLCYSKERIFIRTYLKPFII